MSLPPIVTPKIEDMTPEQRAIFDRFQQQETPAHQVNMERLTQLDQARVQKKEGRQATKEELEQWRKEREEEWPHELFRWLRGLKYDIAKTSIDYHKYLMWREKAGIDSIMDELPFNCELIDRIVGNCAEGQDHDGRPIYIEKGGGVNVDLFMSVCTDEDILRSHLWQQENSVRRALALTKSEGKYIDNFCQIVDLAGLGTAHQRALKFSKTIFDHDAAYYPERLGQLFVVNQGFFFNMIWAIVKGWIDPITRQKIHMVKGEIKDTLLTKIDAKHLPSDYGGTGKGFRNWTFEDAIDILPMRGEDLNLTSINIKAGSNFTQEHELQAGEVVEWYWEMDKGSDIDFSVTFTPTGVQAGEWNWTVAPTPSSSSASSTPAPAVSPSINVVTACRIHSLGIGAQGSYQAKTAGHCNIMWDNKFSVSG